MIHKNQTWQLVDIPPIKKLVITKWVYKMKTDVDGTIKKLKTRLVAKGFQQRAMRTLKKHMHLLQNTILFE
jgi:hypothetical protein